ncbi:zinc metalloprotease, partial [Actinocorallia lasiicapitis]
PDGPSQARRARGADLATGNVLRMDRDLRGRLRGPVPANVQVPVLFHVLTAGRIGALDDAAVARQMNALNAAYSGANGGADTGVRFVLRAVDRVDNSAWFNDPGDYEPVFKERLHRGGPDVLNLYTAAVGQDVLGFSTFPQWLRGRPLMDGVVVDYRSLPGGSYRHFDLGFTAVHETGHWLGLFHTFENGCLNPGDGVADTPPEAMPTEGCPVRKNTCVAPGDDPVHNYMDYGYDDCMTEFTAGQAARIRASWAAYRMPAVTTDR